jgi:hypothetical protein
LFCGSAGAGHGGFDGSSGADQDRAGLFGVRASDLLSILLVKEVVLRLIFTKEKTTRLIYHKIDMHPCISQPVETGRS